MRITLNKWIEMFKTSLAIFTLKVALSEKSAAKTSWQTYLSSSSPINEHQHSSQTILGISSTSPSQCLPIAQSRGLGASIPHLQPRSVPRGTLAAAIMEFPARDSDGDEILPEPLGGPNSTPFALMGSFFVAESRASLLEGEYEDVAIVAASSAGARYWGGETSSVPQDSTATKADGSFRWPGIDY
ncbi:hypothetical protein TWF132_001310 [Orbilia oligospora]|nr:hypothetical protein TWF128_008829 [Orbilia oligospora]KAF3278053.1 hypothetical protein TWF132_001310 [Orbilia oligospora]